MDLTSEAISKIVSISNPETYDLVDANGRPARYSSKPLVEVRAQPPEAGDLWPATAEDLRKLLNP